MENTHSTFLVLRISEDKDNGNTDIDVVESFVTMTDAKNYKDAKDLIWIISFTFFHFAPFWKMLNVIETMSEFAVVYLSLSLSQKVI